MTVKNLAAYFFNNGDPDTVTVHSRKNGANGNLTCNIASQSNALGQDTSNSDSIAVGDDYDFSFAGQGNGSPGSGNMITVDYIFACRRMEIVSLLVKMLVVLASIPLSHNILV
jgi:hypothetical protein